MSKEAMKLALEALEFIPKSGSMLGTQAETKRLQAIAVMKEALVMQQISEPCRCGKQTNAWCMANTCSKAQQALDKMAENARELGLDYEVEPKIGCVNHDCDKCKALAEQPAQQEPVAWPCLIAKADFSEDTVTLAMQCTDYKVSAGKHWLYTSPPEQRTWVGLTDEEITDIWAESSPYYHEDDFARAIEAKLKEKNNG